MANLWSDKVDTNGDYQDLSVVSGISLTEGVTYVFQGGSTYTICISENKPTSGGFLICGSPIVRFKLNANEKAWIATYNGVKVYMNLAA